MPRGDEGSQRLTSLQLDAESYSATRLYFLSGLEVAERSDNNFWSVVDSSHRRINDQVKNPIHNGFWDELFRMCIGFVFLIEYTYSDRREIHLE